MQAINPIFQNEINSITATLQPLKAEADLTFAVVADSHLDDYESETLANIHAVDRQIPFDFLVHLGDFLNGNLPRTYTKQILAEEMMQYRACTQKGIFLPTQGNHDGHCDIRETQTFSDVTLDEDWYEATCFTQAYPHCFRSANKPYYYLDYPEIQTRLVILSSFSYQIDDDGKFRKQYALEPAQLEWLASNALSIGSDWTVLLFSHDGPLTYFDPSRYAEEPWTGNNRQLMQIVLDARRLNDFSIAGWFIGHWHGDLCQNVMDIPFILVGSQTCYIPQLWDMPDLGHYEPRVRRSTTQDLWDAVTLNRSKRELQLCRFGAGSDRIIHY